MQRLNQMAKYSWLARCFAELSSYVREQIQEQNISAGVHKLDARLEDGLGTLRYHAEKERYNEQIKEAVQYCNALREGAVKREDLEKYAAFFKGMIINSLRNFDRVRFER